jgi:hypothetical protein
MNQIETLILAGSIFFATGCLWLMFLAWTVIYNYLIEKEIGDL